jgi:hypothetical protein
MNPVTNDEVTSYASRKCKTCNGTGWLRTWIYLDEDHMERQTGFCGCATRRFNEKAKHKIEKDEQGRVFWKEAVG